jgi:ParB family chromosome partitioning protein
MKSYSVNALEQLVKQQRAEAIAAMAGETPKREAPEKTEKTPHVQGIEDDLRQRLATKVEIRVRAKDKGQIVIAFESNDDFERILEALKR